METALEADVPASAALEKLIISANDDFSSSREPANDIILAAYNYESLASSNMIRVFDLLPGNDGLQCTMTQIPVEDGHYTALSYEWGTQDMLHKITVVGDRGQSQGYIDITTNLKNALQNLRDSPDVEQKRFWIDQICINQKDTVEKGHQVHFMTRIYKLAAKVVVYLGPHDPDTESENGALNLLDQLHNHFKPNFEHLATVEAIREAFYEKSKLPVQVYPEMTSGEVLHWPALLRIVYSGWLQRLWMVQESMLCRDTIMLRGLRRIDWLAVASVPILFYLSLLDNEILDSVWASLNLAIPRYDVFSSMCLTWIVRLAHVAHSMKDNDCEDPQPVNFLTLATNINFYRHLKCKDPRDRVYAILGISSDSLWLEIQPHYNQSVQAVVVDVSSRIYHQERDLYLFHVISGQEIGDSNIPSWSYHAASAATSSAAGPVGLNPHPTWSCDFKFLDDGNTMRLTGQIVDTIRSLSKKLVEPSGIQSDDDLAQRYRAIFQSFFEVLDNLGYEVTQMNDLVRCWICNHNWCTQNPSDNKVRQFWCLIRYLSYYLNRYTSTSIQTETPLCTQIPELISVVHNLLITVDNNAGSSQQSMSTSHGNRSFDSGAMEDPWSKPCDEDWAIGRFIWQNRKIEHRCIGVTKEKRVCNVTVQAKPGDVIAIFAGGRDAYVLRPAGDRYRYIGTAYVDEFKDGAFYERDGKDPKEVAREIDYEILLI
jgi:hypothetical protein